MRVLLRALKIALAVVSLCAVSLAAAEVGLPPLAGVVFLDGNGNGLRDPGERGLAGAAVSLYRKEPAGDELLSTAVTDSEGAFSVQPARPGDHCIKALLPDGFVFTMPAAGGSLMLPAIGRASSSAGFAVSPGLPLSAPLLVGAVRKPSFINVVAFGDDNANGGRFSSEPLLRDVRIDLLFEMDGGIHTVASAKTDREGFATFRDLSPGTYRIAATLPDPYIVGPLGSKINPFYNCIRPADSPHGLSDPFRVPYMGSTGLGVGGVQTGSAAGRLWLDEDIDGKADREETGFAGAELTLRNEALGVSRLLSPGADGSFVFDALQAGEYILTARLPEQLMFTLPGGDSLFFNGYSREESTVVRVVAKETARVGSIGAIPVTSLVVHAFHDMNVNGVREEGEPAFAGATLEVLSGDSVAASALSDGNGAALIPILRGGEVRIRCTLPDRQVFSVEGGPGGNAFSSLLAVSAVTVERAIGHGTKGELFAAVTLPAAVAGTLFEDADISGAYEAGEKMLPGFIVKACRPDGAAVLETATNADGRYQLSGLIPGQYLVRVLLRPPYVFSPSFPTGEVIGNKIVRQIPEYGETELLALAPGQSAVNVDGALFRSAVIEGYVLIGNGADGFSGKAGGLRGVFVELYDEYDAPVSDYTVARTDVDGYFLLKGALPGVYSLQYTLPENAAFSKPLISSGVFQTDQFSVESSAELEAPTLFAEKTGTVSGLVFLDGDDDGLFGAGDSPLGGAAFVVRSNAGGPIVETRSRPDGTYHLDGLRPGTYTLTVTVPEGMLVSHSDSSPVPPTVSHTAQAPFEVTMGMLLGDRQIAAVSSASLSGTLYFDENLDRLRTEGEMPYPGAELSLRHRLSGIEFTALTGAGGTYAVPALFPGAYDLSVALPGDFELFAPAGARKSANRWSAGIQVSAAASVIDAGLVQFCSLHGSVWNLDGSQTGIGGLPVRLYQGNGTLPLVETRTDEDGSYRLDSLYPGQYSLSLSLPGEYRFARPADARGRMSLITSESASVARNLGRSDVFTLAMGEKRAGQDIGMGSMGKLGDIAWLDTDGDGMQDAGEPGVPGIVIRLFQYGAAVAETVTDPYGRYLFDELYPGSYTVEVTMHAELRPTIRQTAYPLVASVLNEAKGVTASADNIVVPSGSRNLNCDFGFVPVARGVLPELMRNLPKKDWTPYVNVVPSR